MSRFRYRVKVIALRGVEHLEFEPVGEAPPVVGICQRDPAKFGRVTDGVVFDIDPAKHEAVFGVVEGVKEVRPVKKPSAPATIYPSAEAAPDSGSTGGEPVHQQAG